MTTLHHRVKTHGNWQVTQPFPGIYLWRDPHAQTYLVDHTGTRPLGNAIGTADGTTDDGVAMPDLTVDASDGPDNGELDYQPHRVA